MPRKRTKKDSSSSDEDFSKIKKKQASSTSHKSPITKTENSDEQQQTIQEPPYGAEYAKSGRSTCKGCKQPIAKGTLRMAVRFQSKLFDGYQDLWHHFDCFWKRARKNDINEISIRGIEWLKWEDQEKIRKMIQELKANPDTISTPKIGVPKIEHAKSSAGKCFKCKESIEKAELRVSYRASFYHAKCFAGDPSLRGNTVPKNLAGYDDLDNNEKKGMDNLFPKLKPEKSANANLGEGTSGLSTPSKSGPTLKSKKKLEKQAKILWKMRDGLRDNLSREEAEELLGANGLFWPKKGGIERALDYLVDCATFGATEPCPECKGSLIYSNNEHTYKCRGMVSEYTRCTFSVREPKRKKFSIPKGLREENDYLKNLKNSLLPQRVYPKFDETEQKIVQDPKSFAKLNEVAKSAKKSARNGSSSAVASKLIVKGGCTVDPDCEVAETTHVYIDPVTKKPWQATLSAADVQTGKNSFYKLQMLQEDDANKFHIFRSWGRVGTTVGKSMTEDFGIDKESCEIEFRRLFQEKTRNDWDQAVAGNFKKNPFGMDLVETEFHNPKGIEIGTIDIHKSKSALQMPIKKVISMIFDINMMNNTLHEFQIDTQKMPLGKLSHRHLLNAYQVLTDLQTALDTQAQLSRSQLVDFSNRFYTLIPHSFGLSAPTLINDREMIKKKTELLDNLLEMEVAYNIIKSESAELEGEKGKKKDPIDIHYEKLKCNMEVIDNESPEFKVIKKYVENTHAPTHNILVEIDQIIKLDRDGERARFPSNMPNRQYLWHGSRVTNFAGILSQGLRIAPPEAPVTGYMFGKGIYTADMVTKSSNYCFPMNGEGLLLLCEVALGEMEELKASRDVRRLKKGNNSVKGLGQMYPDPDEAEKLFEAVVPCGKPIKSDEADLPLLYNEYIVYDEAQVRLGYLVHAKFTQKGGDLL